VIAEGGSRITWKASRHVFNVTDQLSHVRQSLNGDVSMANKDRKFSDGDIRGDSRVPRCAACSQFSRTSVSFKTTAIDHSAIPPHFELSLGILPASLFHPGQ
jgi:hypothetical protein